MKKRIYVTGSDGLVGSRFVEMYKEKYDLYTPEINELDITNRPTLDKYFSKNKFDAVINFAAFTNVGEGEKQRGDKKGLCYKINVAGAENLAEMCDKYGARLIHISTDMVFSGSEEDKGPYSEDKLPEKDLEKVTWYGYTKGLGENAVKKVLKKKATIVRIIYPVRAVFTGKMDYLRFPLSLFDQDKLYPMFSNQQVSNAFIDEVALTLDVLIEKEKFGIFHVSSPNTTTPKEFVSLMLEKTRGKKGAVRGQTVEEFTKKTGAPTYRYPKYGGLTVQKTQKALSLKYSNSEEILDKMIKQGLGKK